jgi:hypothetical protein
MHLPINEPQLLRDYVARFVPLDPLARRIVAVLQALPREAQADFLEDTQFRLAVDNYLPSRGRTVWMACPDLANGSRSVVLKPGLANCSEDYAHYIIAHEFAHAYLRNCGWGSIQDPEDAANALAAQWGFARPPTSEVVE